MDRIQAFSYYFLLALILIQPVKSFVNRLSTWVLRIIGLLGLDATISFSLFPYFKIRLTNVKVSQTVLNFANNWMHRFIPTKVEKIQLEKIVVHFPLKKVLTLASQVEVHKLLVVLRHTAEDEWDEGLYCWRQVYRRRWLADLYSTLIEGKWGRGVPWYGWPFDRLIAQQHLDVHTLHVKFLDPDSNNSWGVIIAEYKLWPGQRSEETLQAVPRHTSLKKLVGYVDPAFDLPPNEDHYAILKIEKGTMTVEFPDIFSTMRVSETMPGGRGKRMRIYGEFFNLQIFLQPEQFSNFLHINLHCFRTGEYNQWRMKQRKKVYEACRPLDEDEAAEYIRLLMEASSFLDFRNSKIRSRRLEELESLTSLGEILNLRRKAKGWHFPTPSVGDNVREEEMAFGCHIDSEHVDWDQYDAMWNFLGHKRGECWGKWRYLREMFVGPLICRGMRVETSTTDKSRKLNVNSSSGHHFGGMKLATLDAAYAVCFFRIFLAKGKNSADGRGYGARPEDNEDSQPFMCASGELNGCAVVDETHVQRGCRFPCLLEPSSRETSEGNLEAPSIPFEVGQNGSQLYGIWYQYTDGRSGAKTGTNFCRLTLLLRPLVDIFQGVRPCFQKPTQPDSPMDFDGEHPTINRESFKHFTSQLGVGDQENTIEEDVPLFDVPLDATFPEEDAAMPVQQKEEFDPTPFLFLQGLKFHNDCRWEGLEFVLIQAPLNQLSNFLVIKNTGNWELDSTPTSEMFNAELAELVVMPATCGDPSGWPQEQAQPNPHSQMLLIEIKNQKHLGIEFKLENGQVILKSFSPTAAQEAREKFREGDILHKLNDLRIENIQMLTMAKKRLANCVTFIFQVERQLTVPEEMPQEGGRFWCTLGTRGFELVGSRVILKPNKLKIEYKTWFGPEELSSNSEGDLESTSENTGKYFLRQASLLSEGNSEDVGSEALPTHQGLGTLKLKVSKIRFKERYTQLMARLEKLNLLVQLDDERQSMASRQAQADTNSPNFIFDTDIELWSSGNFDTLFLELSGTTPNTYYKPCKKYKWQAEVENIIGKGWLRFPLLQSMPNAALGYIAAGDIEVCMEWIPKSILITLHQARDLNMGSDEHNARPYVQIQVDSQIQRSSIGTDPCNPKFEEFFKFTCTKKTPAIKATLYNEGRIMDEAIGFCEVDSQAFNSLIWHDIYSNEGQYIGQLEMRLSWSEESRNNEPPLLDNEKDPSPGSLTKPTLTRDESFFNQQEPPAHPKPSKPMIHRNINVNGGGWIMSVTDLDMMVVYGAVESTISMLDPSGKVRKALTTLSKDRAREVAEKLMREAYNQQEEKVRKLSDYFLAQHQDAQKTGVLNREDVVNILKCLQRKKNLTESEVEYEVAQFMKEWRFDSSQYVEVNELIRNLECSLAGKDQSYKGYVLSRCGEFSSKSVVREILGKHKGLPEMLAVMPTDAPFSSFWRIFERETGASKYTYRNQSAKTIQTKMVRAFKNYDFAKDAWRYLVVPALHGISRCGLIRARSRWQYLQMPSPVCVGDQYYVDKKIHYITSLPLRLQNQLLTGIKTARKDRSAGGKRFLKFHISCESTVFLCHDQRLPKPGWLRELGFTQIESTITTTEGSFDIFQRLFEAGNVTLGANNGWRKGCANYFVLILPLRCENISRALPHWVLQPSSLAGGKASVAQAIKAFLEEQQEDTASAPMSRAAPSTVKDYGDRSTLAQLIANYNSDNQEEVLFNCSINVILEPTGLQIMDSFATQTPRIEFITEYLRGTVKFSHIYPHDFFGRVDNLQADFYCKMWGKYYNSQVHAHEYFLEPWDFEGSANSLTGQPLAHLKGVAHSHMQWNLTSELVGGMEALVKMAELRRKLPRYENQQALRTLTSKGSHFLVKNKVGKKIAVVCPRDEMEILTVLPGESKEYCEHQLADSKNKDIIQYISFIIDGYAPVGPILLEDIGAKFYQLKWVQREVCGLTQISEPREQVKAVLKIEIQPGTSLKHSTSGVVVQVSSNVSVKNSTSSLAFVELDRGMQQSVDTEETFFLPLSVIQSGKLKLKGNCVDTWTNPINFTPTLFDTSIPDAFRRTKVLDSNSISLTYHSPGSLHGGIKMPDQVQSIQQDMVEWTFELHPPLTFVNTLPFKIEVSLYQSSQYFPDESHHFKSRSYRSKVNVEELDPALDLFFLPASVNSESTSSSLTLFPTSSSPDLKDFTNKCNATVPKDLTLAKRFTLICGERYKVDEIAPEKSIYFQICHKSTLDFPFWSNYLVLEPLSHSNRQIFNTGDQPEKVIWPDSKTSSHRQPDVFISRTWKGNRPRTLVFYANFWMINKTGLGLEYNQSSRRAKNTTSKFTDTDNAEFFSDTDVPALLTCEGKTVRVMPYCLIKDIDCPPLYISEIRTKGSSVYRCKRKPEKGNSVYVDEDCKLVDISENFLTPETVLLMTAMADGGANPNHSDFLTFFPSENCYVTLCIDARLEQRLPEWVELKGFRRIPNNEVTVSIHKIPSKFIMYQKFYNGMSTVTLGGNGVVLLDDSSVFITPFTYFVFISRARHTDEVDVSNIVLTRDVKDRMLCTKKYAVWPNFKPGDKCYVDREYTIPYLPPELLEKKLLAILTAQDDKRATGKRFLQFNVLQDSAVLVCYDERAEHEPSWLHEYAFIQQKYKVPGATYKRQYMYRVFRKNFKKGLVTLGGNGAPGCKRNYFVLVFSNFTTERNEMDTISMTCVSDTGFESDSDFLENEDDDTLSELWEDGNGSLTQLCPDFEKDGGRMWSQAFSVDAVNTKGEIEASSILLGVKISALPGLLNRTKVVTFYPRYIVQNQLDIPFEIIPIRLPLKANCNKNYALNGEEVLGNSSVIIYQFNKIEPDSFSPRTSLISGRPKCCIQIKAIGPDNKPSKAICVEELGESHIWVKDTRSKMLFLLAINVKLKNSTIFIALSDATEHPPFRIENRSSHETISFRPPDESTFTYLEPMQWQSFILDTGSKNGELLLAFKGYEDYAGSYFLDRIAVLDPLVPRWLTSGLKIDARKLFVEVRAEGRSRVISLHDAPRPQPDASRWDNSLTQFRAMYLCMNAQLSFAGWGLSIVESTQSGPIEQIAITIDKFEMKKKGMSDSAELSVFHFQIDDMRPKSRFPVVFQPIHSGFNSRMRMEDDEIPFLKVSYERELATMNIPHFKSIEIKLQEMNVKLDVDYFFDLSAFFNRLVAIFISGETMSKIERFTVNQAIHQKLVPPIHSQDYVVYLEDFHHFPIIANTELLVGQRVINFDPTTLTEAENPALTAISVWILSVLKVFGSSFAHASPTFIFNEIVIQHYFGDPIDFGNTLVTTLVQQGLKQGYKLLGSMELLGDPISLANKVGSGVLQFFQKTGSELAGTTNSTGAGVQILVKNVVGGTFGSAAKITGTLEGLVNAVAGKSLEDMHAVENKPLHLKDGLQKGSQVFYENVKEGVSGVVGHPLKGAQQQGVTGFIKGVGQGIVGVVAAPVAGALGAVSRVSAGVDATTRLSEQKPIGHRRKKRNADNILLDPISKEDLSWVEYDKRYVDCQSTYLSSSSNEEEDNNFLVTEEVHDADHYNEEEDTRESESFIVTEAVDL